jgi:hypothetical protein
VKQAEAVAWLIQPQLLRAELVGLVGIFVSINGCVGLFVSACVLMYVVLLPITPVVPITQKRIHVACNVKARIIGIH